MVVVNIAMSQTNTLPKSLFVFYIKYAIRGHWLLVLFWCVLFFAVASDGILFPMFQRWFVSLFEQSVPANQTFLQFAMPTIITITGIFILWDICLVLRALTRARWQPTISNQISEVLNDFVQNQSMSFWTGRMAGKIKSQIDYVSRGFDVIINFMEMLSAGIVIIINVGLILDINIYVAFVFAFVFLFRIVYGALLIQPMSKASKRSSDSNSSLSGKIIDSISNYSVVKLFAGAEKERKYLEKSRKKSIKDHIHSYFVQRWFWSVPNFIWDLSFGITMILCVVLFSEGNMKISDIVFTVSVFFSVMGTIGQIINQIPVIVDTLGSAKKSYEELNVPMEVIDIENAPDLIVSRGKIEFKHVWFKYKKKWILKDFNLTINPGESIGLVGASGAGKTTLVSLLMRFYNPNRGKILIDGQDISMVNQDSLRRNVAFIPQEPTMFNRNLKENIGYGRDGATMKEIKSAAIKASADKFIMDTENKYDSLVGDRGIKLSGGQRQRIAIARAFLKNAPILVLDEATSALDSETEISIQKSFEELSLGRTTIAIAHRLSTLRNMDRIVVLNDGKIIEQGSHNQLIRAKGEYCRLWNMQSGGFLQE